MQKIHKLTELDNKLLANDFHVVCLAVFPLKGDIIPGHDFRTSPARGVLRIFQSVSAMDEHQVHILPLDLTLGPKYSQGEFTASRHWVRAPLGWTNTLSTSATDGVNVVLPHSWTCPCQRGGLQWTSVVLSSTHQIQPKVHQRSGTHNLQ